ncbi:ATP-dependent DNA helicase [Hirsutella rhossiliensis]|uniref:ATP-dependent DNA helicase n=1 Tax=Hirsutella rhossiliensis TaxID=111463 RepID=A0A9P8MSR4_9HYPO|nr:ATP-dependent DNA helicase [Hirsutella rhossiliensis]KAH0960382.1 ATP-dependent DNA helicase [Hirsutella rhossiliensis]
MFPDELNGLTPVEEKLISLNSCYGFVTRYSIPGGQRQAVRYPRHVKGHITVFPNNVQELARKVLPHPLLQTMDEIHVSWQGAEKPAPSDLSGLLSVRRQVVERALVWLKKNNPHYADIEIDKAEMDSWGTPSHGVPSMVYGRMERNEPSAWEKTRTAQVVPPAERAMDGDSSAEIEEVLARLHQGQDPEDGAKMINEITSSGMFALDGPPDVSDAEKLRFACNAVSGDGAEDGRPGPRAWIRSAGAGRGGMDVCEPYIHVGRGEEFADSLDASFFAKTFPTLLPFGFGGPRLAEEFILGPEGSVNPRGTAAGEETAARDLLSSRNMSLRTWAGIVLRRHGGRFATHAIFSFLLFNMDVGGGQGGVESSGTTTDDGVKELLRCLSLYGYRQPMSRELRLSMRRKIQSLILCRGVPAIWFTLNPNDITNPVKLRLAAYRTRDPEAAEAFLRSLDMAFKRARLAISDPLSSAEFFHREMTLFFENYVRVGEESGNAHLSSMLVDIHGEDQAAYRERIVRYVDSVFSEDLDQEGFCAIQAERSVTSDISQLLGDERQFSASFDEEANFCAGATQIHTHSPTCVKYSLGKGGRKSDLCRFKAPWGLVDETAFTGDGVLRIRRSHSMVNRWNKAIAVGLRHNHDISFIATQRKTMALVFYVTNYATKVEDPVWKRVVAAADLLPPRAGDGMADDAEVRGGEGGGDDGKQNRTRQFLMKVANRVFTERPLSQVEVIADLLGYPTELTNNGAWAFLNVSVLYWHVFRQWPHLRRESGASTADGSVDESILVEEAGQRICRVEAYRHRGDVLRGLCLYDYISLVRLKRNDTDKRPAAWGEVPLESGWAPGSRWVQVLRRPGKQAMVCLDGYLSKDFDEDDEGSCYRRAAVQHLALFVPWESFLGEESGGIDRIWRRERAALVPRISCYVDNVQLLRRSAEDAKRDAKQWAASSGDRDATAVHPDEDGTGRRVSSLDRSSIGANQITAGSPELTAMMQELSRFQQLALSSSSEFQAAILSERGPRRINIPGRAFSGARIPPQSQVRAIKSQQTCASREREKMIRGIQSVPTAAVTDRRAAVRSVLTGFGDDDIQMTAADLEETVEEASAGMEIRLGTSTSFIEAGKALVARFTLNKKQAIAFLIICRQLDLIRRREKATDCSSTDQRHHDPPACGFSKDLAAVANTGKDLDGVRMPNQAERTVVSWDMDNSFKAEQRHQHDKAHALWKRFTAVVMLDEQVRAADDPELQRLLKRIRLGVQDRTDLDLLNTRCYQEGRQIPWASGITVVTPLNRNRWNLNMEASLAFQIQHRSTLRIFISGHKWKEGLPTEEEAIMILNQGDDSAIPVPAVFMFVPGMPVVVNHNTHQGLKLVNGASYAALEVILDKSYPGHRISADMTIHFGRRRDNARVRDDERCSIRRDAARHDLVDAHDRQDTMPAKEAVAAERLQGRTLERVALELRGTRTSNIEGRAVSSQCDPYSLYVQLSRCPTLDGIMLVSKVRERDLVGNKVPDEMTDAEARLGRLSDKTVREALEWLDVDSLDPAGLHVKLS